MRSGIGVREIAASLLAGVCRSVACPLPIYSFMVELADTLVLETSSN